MHWYVYELIRIFNILLVNDSGYWPIILLIHYVVKISYQSQSKRVDNFSNAVSRTLVHHMRLFYINEKNWFRFGQVKYITIYAFGGNNDSDFRGRQVPVIVVCSSPKEKSLSKPEPVQSGIKLCLQGIPVCTCFTVYVY